GLLPAGWTLTNTQHISDDGSRIFCLATAPDNSQRAVMLTGTFLIPAPGSGLVFAALAPAGLRRRSRSAWNR
ncbi:MAG: hypothetical protein SFZ24_02345, partial [Planctomycetota bacterium]|nr:hypothetical protein [Planctomycetota bacterium]